MQETVCYNKYNEYVIFIHNVGEVMSVQQFFQPFFAGHLWNINMLIWFCDKYVLNNVTLNR